MSDGLPQLSASHLLDLTDATGMIEHARGAVPATEHGYCVDDVARGLTVACRAGALVGDAPWRHLAETYLAFLEAMARPDGRFHNRMSVGGEITDEVGPDDTWGRAVMGLGATNDGPWPELAARARQLVGPSLEVRSPFPRSMAFAGIGAAALLDVDGAEALARAAAGRLAVTGADPTWPWIEPRLTYANATLPEAVLAVGAALGDQAAVELGLAQLDWLVELETCAGQLSVTPSVGWAPGETRPGFDQQPIEVAGLSSAALRAWTLTGEARWEAVIDHAVAWFLGANDVGIAMCDVVTGAGYDGLTPAGRNDNRGAESTLAWLSTWLDARQTRVASNRSSAFPLRSKASTSSSPSSTAAPTKRSEAP